MLSLELWWIIKHIVLGGLLAFSSTPKAWAIPLEKVYDLPIASQCSVSMTRIGLKDIAIENHFFEKKYIKRYWSRARDVAKDNLSPWDTLLWKLVQERTICPAMMIEDKKDLMKKDKVFWTLTLEDEIKEKKEYCDKELIKLQEEYKQKIATNENEKKIEEWNLKKQKNLLLKLQNETDAIIHKKEKLQKKQQSLENKNNSEKHISDYDDLTGIIDGYKNQVKEVENNIKKIENNIANIEKEIKQLSTMPFKCSYKSWFENIPKEERSDWVLYVRLDEVMKKSPYNYIISSWGKGIVKRAIEQQVIKRPELFVHFLSWRNQEKQKQFLDKVCNFYDKKVKIAHPLAKNLVHSNYYVWFSEQDQRNIIKCVYLRNKEALTIKWAIHTEYAPVRETNIWIGLSSLVGVWKNNETISVLQKTQTKSWYVDGLALFVDKEDKNKVIAKPVPQWWICWVATVFYQTLLNWYSTFRIDERYPHLSFYRQYYNLDWIDASLYADNWVVYKDLKVTNVSWWPLLILTSINPNKTLNTFDYYSTIWSLYPIKKSDIQYWNKFNSNKHTCITNTIIEQGSNKELDKITSCYKWWMH